jgi:hypothetical protein
MGLSGEIVLEWRESKELGFVGGSEGAFDGDVAVSHAEPSSRDISVNVVIGIPLS